MQVISDRKSFFEFLDLYAQDQTARIFRGVSSNKYSLQPSIGRKFYKDGKRRLNNEDQHLMFRQFKQRAVAFLTKQYDDMNLLAIAQHHGLPTHLLDWTFNPLAALYFAVEKEISNTGNAASMPDYSVVYVWDKQHNAIVNKKFKSIFVEKLELFIPDFNDDRIINQNGIFSVHPYPWEPLTIDRKSKIIAIKIELSFRRELRKLLNRLGVNEATIYPGLDGIASHVRWMRTFDY